MESRPSLERAIERAESKILWGDPEDQVYQFLVKEGLGPGRAEEAFREARRRAGKEIRKIGVRKVIFGLIIAGICGGVIAFIFFVLNLIWPWAMGLIAIGLVYGLTLFFTGLAKLFGGAAAARTGSSGPF